MTGDEIASLMTKCGSIPAHRIWSQSTIRSKYNSRTKPWESQCMDPKQKQIWLALIFCLTYFIENEC